MLNTSTRFKKGEHRTCIKLCDKCLNAFVSKSGSRKRCPDCCRCEWCGKQLPNASHRFCGNSCAGKWKYQNSQRVRDAIALGQSIPKNLEKIFAKIRGRPRYSTRGEKNHNWRGGGKRNERHTEMGRIEYINWRKSVFDRDDYTCQNCGDRCEKGNSVYLHAHHIKKWHDFIELRYSVDNGTTLCVPCHREIHGLSPKIIS